MGWYDVAQVCPNGHVANDAVKRHPDFSKTYCEQCGEQTIVACPSCDDPIRGEYHVEGIAVIGAEYHPPAFCQNCGSAFPWTQRRQQAAMDLFLEEDTSKRDQDEFRESLQQIARDTPQASVASRRVGRLLGKIGKQTASAIRDILVTIASETARKALLTGN